MSDFISSVGIDIGTTSTHLVFSRLKYETLGTADEVPRLAVTGREIIHEGAIHFTPVTADGAIDAAAAAALVRAEYKLAGIEPSSIQSGAAIITGETARLRNAEQVIHELANLAGNLVAASAGPHLESILAARGSGAAARSKSTGCTICNIDIGGGTTNIAVCRDGEVIDTACIALGARCLQFDRGGTIKAITDSGETFLDAVARSASVDQQMTAQQMSLLAALIAECLVQYLCSTPKPQLAQRLLITEPLNFSYAIDEYCLSGGVAHLMRSPVQDPLLFGDLGGYLAQGLKDAFAKHALQYSVADNAIRATVIGAGLHSIQLSGTTVLADACQLPVINLPLLSPFEQPGPANPGKETLLQQMQRCLKLHDIDWTISKVAIKLPPLPDTNFDTLSNWASALAEMFAESHACEPFILIASQDVALALGQLLRHYLEDRQLIILDGISSLSGDYIDIGRPLAATRALPVIVKDLVFGR